MKIRKIDLDIYRLIAAFLIVAIHTYPFMSINKTFEFLFTHVLCRIGVPFFLMLTGYFILPKSINKKENLIKYTKKIIKIYLISIIIYLPINIYANHLTGLNIIGLLKLIFIDGTMYHLWYFPGLILGIWITYFLIKKCNKKYIFSITIILYILGLLGDSYYGLIKQVPLLISIYDFIFHIFKYTRNGLFYVPIFLYLGYIFSKKEIKNTKKDIILIFLLIIIMLIEGYILHIYNIQKHDSMYITLIPLMYALFKKIINKKNINNKIIRNISTTIYIMHPFFIVIVRMIGKILHLEKIIINNSLIHYLIVLMITILFSILIEYIRYVFEKKYNKENNNLNREG